MKSLRFESVGDPNPRPFARSTYEYRDEHPPKRNQNGGNAPLATALAMPFVGAPVWGTVVLEAVSQQPVDVQVPLPVQLFNVPPPHETVHGVLPPQVTVHSAPWSQTMSQPPVGQSIVHFALLSQS